jgi:glycosyltransferase involved in cell wall biosynthesis
MILGYYYHVLAFKKNESTWCLPAYFARFIIDLAEQVTELYLFLHESESNDNNEYDTAILSENIRWVSMGKSSAAWHRSLFAASYIKKVKAELDKLDYMIVRSPSPLAPYFKNYVRPEQLIYLVVGDYKEGAKQFRIRSFRDWIITWYLRHNDWKLKEAMQNQLIMVNSSVLLEKYSRISKNIHLISTSTLRQTDFYERPDTCIDETIHILYVGRMDPSKGLNELIESLILLKNLKRQIHLHIVGWEERKEKLYTQHLQALCEEGNVSNMITFHGKKKAGVELNNFYRKADIFLLPSYFEGFPRVIWEAMANSLPVITTSVGGIPFHLEHEKHALLIEAKSANAIEEAILTLINDKEMRIKLISEGRKIAAENTSSQQVRKILAIISEYEK